MAKLFGKLNVLVRSSINNVLGDDPDRSRSPRLGKNMDRNVEAMRQQVNQALDDEDRQLADIEALRQQIASWDQQADQALSKGDDATARHAVQQMQAQQRQLSMLEAELAQHRIATSDLINRVNELEAVVAEARRQISTGDKEETSGGGLSARLNQARQRIDEQRTKPAPAETPTVDEVTIEDDLARRRARLSQQD